METQRVAHFVPLSLYPTRFQVSFRRGASDRHRLGEEVIAIALRLDFLFAAAFAITLDFSRGPLQAVPMTLNYAARAVP